MISANIEKEIQKKNKILLGLTLRQLLTVVCCLIFAVIMGLILPFEIAIYPDLIIGGLAWFIGWYTKDGLTAEKILLKLLQEKFYKNGKRKYRTKNKYISLMNTEYIRHRTIDYNDKQTKKAIAKEAKQNKKRVKTSSMKSIA